MAHFQRHILRAIFRHFRRGFIDSASNHHTNDSINAGFGGGNHINIAPVPHHSDAVSNLLQLLQTMGDMDNAHPLRAQLAGDVKEFVYLRFRQSRSRLIHN